MTDVSTNNIVIPIDGADVEFGRLRPNDLFKIVDEANREVIHDGLAALGDIPIGERIKAVRELGETYDYSDIDTLLTRQKYALQLIFRSYLRTHPGATQEEFMELFGTDGDLALVCESIDKLMWGTATAEAATSTDPPAVTATTD